MLHRTQNPRQRARRSHGFTLVETLVVVSLIGLVTTAIATAFVVFVRTDDSVVNRLTNSSDLQNLSSYLPGDVASANEIQDGSVGHPFNGTFTIADCYSTADAVGNPILRLGWTQRWRDGSSSEFESVYNVENVDEIYRYTCRDDELERVVVARHFTSPPVVNLPLDGSGDLVGTVEIVLTYNDVDRRLTASSRNYVP